MSSSTIGADSGGREVFYVEEFCGHRKVEPADVTGDWTRTGSLVRGTAAEDVVDKSAAWDFDVVLH